MESVSEYSGGRESEVRRQFDRVLAGHLQRFAGLGTDGDAAVFSGTGLACMVLASQKSDPPFTYTSLMSDVADWAPAAAPEVPSALAELEGRGYIQKTAGSGFSPQPPLFCLLKRLGEIFPDMTGMNLVVYWSQTIEEVVSGRKNMAEALEQFEQTLKIHQQQESRPPQPSTNRPSTSNILRSRKVDPAQLSLARPSKIVSGRQNTRIQSVSFGAPPTATPDANHASAATETAFGAQTKDVEKNAVEAEIPDSAENIEKEKPDPNPAALDDKPAEAMERDAAAVSLEAPQAVDFSTNRLQKDLSNKPGEAHAESHSGSPPENREADAAHTADAAADEPPAAVETPAADQTHGADSTVSQPPVQAPPVSQPAVPSLDDESIVAERIEAFEDDLSKECPVCRTGKIVLQKTLSQKTYYTCSNPDCHFVSWGKPYHVACPRCKNPFLIELKDARGRLIVKCPRSTCRFRKMHPREAPVKASDTAAVPSKAKNKRRAARQRKVRRR